MAATATERSREHRHRQRAGKIQVLIEVDEVSLVETLLAAKLLERSAVENRDAIADAVEELIEWVVRNREREIK